MTHFYSLSTANQLSQFLADIHHRQFAACNNCRFLSKSDNDYYLFTKVGLLWSGGDCYSSR